MQDTTSIHAPATTPACTLWEAAIGLAYGRAITRYPAEQDRVRRGARIAAQPFGVDLAQHQVQSADGTLWYSVRNGHCACQDRATRCKHLWAKALTKCATAIHQRLLRHGHQWVATVGAESGVLHATEVVEQHGQTLPAGLLFFVPYGGPRGRFVAPADAVLGASCLAFCPDSAEGAMNEAWSAAMNAS